ncbi:MAG: large repetitive protein, partial [Actinomycetota bacterium]|nr:large repetitive protein [Actinomycetota bacterium]
CASGNGGTSGSDTGSGSPIDVTGLTNGKTYTCTVTATNGVGTSPASTASEPVVPATVPDAPAQPSVTRGNQQIVVTFTAPANNGAAITSYAAACTSSNGGTSGNNSGTASPITVTGLTNGKSYTCKVTATNDVGTSSPSPASASVVPAAVPSAPPQPSVSRGNHQIVVTFTAPADNGSAITSYAASCTSPDGGTAATTSGTTSPITVTGLTNGKTYRCRVTATNAVGTGAPSPSSDPVVPAGVPNPPAIGTATSGDSSASVRFGAPATNGSPITSYSASCTSNNGGTSASNTGTTSPIAVIGLSNGKSYTCRVTATNAVGTSAPSAPTAAFVPGRPGAPVNVRAVSGPAPGATGPLKVSFTAGPDYGSPISSYHVACTSTNGGAAGSATGTASPVTVTALTTAKKYRCTVTATSARGTGAASSPARAVVGAPGTVTVLRTLPLAHGLALPFTRAADNGSPITGYRASCTSSDGGAPGSPLQLDSPIVATGLTDGKTYTCIVTAQNDRGIGPETSTGPVVVGRPNVTYLAACTGSAGSVGMSPGLLDSTSKPQTITLASTMSSCTGPYVSSARISFSFRSSTAINCRNAINVTSGGSGTMFWPTPGGMGKSAATLRFVITSSSGHVTKVHFYGDVASKANVFNSAHVSGNITLNRGLQTVAAGGDCSTTSPLTSFGVTSITMKLS